MKTLLRELLERLERLGEDHEEVYDTDVREAMRDAVTDGFLARVEGYAVPDDYAMYSAEVNALVKDALLWFLLLANEHAGAIGLNSFHERLDAFQDTDVQTDRQSTYDEFFGWAKPDEYDVDGKFIPARRAVEETTGGPARGEADKERASSFDKSQAKKLKLRRPHTVPMGSFDDVQSALRDVFPSIQFSWTESGPELIRRIAEEKGIGLPLELQETLQRVPKMLKGCVETGDWRIEFLIGYQEPVKTLYVTLLGDASALSQLSPLEAKFSGTFSEGHEETG